MVAQKCPKGSRFLEVQLAGGLGNQLFQLAYGISLSLGMGSHVRFLEPVKGRTVAIEWLGISTRVPHAFWLENEEIGIVTYTECNCLVSSIYKEPSFVSRPITDFKTNTNISGYFQSESFFIDNQAVIQKYILDRLSLTSDYTLNDASAINLHVRLGDFYRSRRARKFHGLINDSYISKALSRFNFFSHESELRIITDDPDSLQKTIPNSLRLASTVISSSSALKDLRILTESSSLIISNSTFSWWGAYLSSAKVIAPAKWFAGEYSDLNLSKFLYPASWEII